MSSSSDLVKGKGTGVFNKITLPEKQCNTRLSSSILCVTYVYTETANFIVKLAIDTYMYKCLTYNLACICVQ